MFNKKIIISLYILLFICISCNRNNDIDTSNIFSYEYNFEHYGIENNTKFKASTVAGLSNVLSNRKTAIFMISSPLCKSCVNTMKLINECISDKDIIIYNIDTYSDVYPVFGDDSLNMLLDIVKLIDINSEDEIVLPILLIINNGNIEYYLKGDSLHSSNDALNKDKIQVLLQKSLLY